MKKGKEEKSFETVEKEEKQADAMERDVLSKTPIGKKSKLEQSHTAKSESHQVQESIEQSLDGEEPEPASEAKTVLDNQPPSADEAKAIVSKDTPLAQDAEPSEASPEIERIVEKIVEKKLSQQLSKPKVPPRSAEVSPHMSAEDYLRLGYGHNSPNS